MDNIYLLGFDRAAVLRLSDTRYSASQLPNYYRGV